MTTYRNWQNTFGEHEYERGKKFFWPVPSSWSDPEIKSPLARTRKEGGVGVPGILPMLGRMARSKFRDSFPCSVELLTRLANVDQASVRKARVALTNAKLASAEVRERHGQWLLHWTVDPALAATRAQSNASEYFYFSHRLLVGGHWAMASPINRATYIGAATSARVVAKRPEQSWIGDLLVPGTDLSDLCRDFELGGRVRCAVVTRTEISRITGIHPDTVSRHLALVDPEKVGPWGPDERRLLNYSPFLVYQTRTPAVLIHFRDHVPHWPWHLLNHPSRDKLTKKELAEMLPSAPQYFASKPIDEAIASVEEDERVDDADGEHWDDDAPF